MHRNIFYLMFMLLFFQSLNIYSQSKTDWEARFNSVWGLTDFGRKLKISVDGNIYVGGHSFINIGQGVTTLIKYDQSGEVIWKVHTDAGITYNMENMILDQDENLYIAGDHWNGSDFDMLVMKFDSDGNLIWKSLFDGGHWDRGFDLGVDSKGDAYICGHTWFQPEFYNIALVKFDSEGRYDWHKTYTSAGQHSDFGHSLKIDEEDNIYVSGYANEDLVLLKYSPNGDTLWQRSFNTNKVWMDIELNFIELDINGNIVLCGNYYNQSTKEDILVVKYDKDGNLLWSKTWNSSGGNTDMISFQAATDNALALDHSGNIFVTGTVINPNISFGEDVVILKYSPDGVLQWQHIYNGPANDWDNPLSIAVDILGDIYVCGFTVEIVNSLVPEDYLTIKLDGNSGNLLWKETFNGIGDFSDRAYAIGVDKDLNVFVTGISSNSNNLFSTDNDIITIKYSQVTTSVSQDLVTSDKFSLSDNYPNPFNPSTKIAFNIPVASFVNLTIFNLLGEEVKTLLNENRDAGNHTINFDASGLGSGVYLYKIQAEKFVQVKKMILSK